jgi:hypothetical protein
MLPRVFVALCLLGVLSAGCHDTCFLVVGCRNEPRIAVDGRILEVGGGEPQRNVALKLRVSSAAAIESTTTTSDEQGLFHLELPALADSVLMALDVRPTDKPGYVLQPLPCQPVTRWGDACALNALVVDPRLPFFVFVSRTHPDQPIANAFVSFVRTGGTAFFGPAANLSTSAITDDGGSANIFPDGLYAAGLDPVIGDLTVDMPAPLGRIVRHGYAVKPGAWFSQRDVALQRVGPIISYRLGFVDSASNAPIQRVAVRFVRVGGIALESNSGAAVSDSLGFASITASPFVFGSITADLSITPPGSSITTSLPNTSLAAFDADSAITLGKWKVGKTGVLYIVPPANP